MSESFITECKKYIEENNLDYMKTYYSEIVSRDDLDWPLMFKNLYLHACLKKKADIASWFETTLFPAMDPIQQFALRQIFPYGRHLLSKN